MMSRPLSGFALLHAVSGLGVWAVCFVVLYGGLTVGCWSPYAQHTLGPFNVVSLALVLAWALHAALLGLMFMRAWMRARGTGEARRGSQEKESLAARPARSADGDAFVRWLTVILHGMSFIALVALAAPLLVLKPCI